MLELCHSINSVWAQKVRIALAEKGLDYEDRLMTLRGDQFDPAHMKLNPNAIVPTPIAWWARVRERPSVQTSILKRMIEADQAPFMNFGLDPWPKASNILAA